MSQNEYCSWNQIHIVPQGPAFRGSDWSHDYRGSQKLSGFYKQSCRARGQTLYTPNIFILNRCPAININLDSVSQSSLHLTHKLRGHGMSFSGSKTRRQLKKNSNFCSAGLSHTRVGRLFKHSLIREMYQTLNGYDRNPEKLNKISEMWKNVVGYDSLINPNTIGVKCNLKLSGRGGGGGGGG